MKRAFIILSALLAALFCEAQNRVVERTYISVDKDICLSGDILRCSAFCVDAATGAFSNLSAVAYLELHSPKSVVASAKIGLTKGRGAGEFQLPANLPTGNYRLIAYTAQNKAESGYDYSGLASKTISVYNPYSSARTEGGVKVSEEPSPKVEVTPCGDGVTASISAVLPKASTASLTLACPLAEDVSVSVSVYHEDGIPHPSNPVPADFRSELHSARFGEIAPDAIPDLEGEVIRGRVAGWSREKRDELAGKFAFISAPGNESDVYASEIDDHGGIMFFTGNIYGRKELVTEIEGIDSSLNCHMELESPFVEASLPSAEPLVLHRDISNALATRFAALQIEKRFASDTLLDYLPRRGNVLFEDGVRKSYILEDYTRFTLMKEVMIEFIPELRARTIDGVRDIQVRVYDGGLVSHFSKGASLLMMDGVPVFDQSKIYEYDPLLVERIDVYPYTYYVGPREYEGIANFVTYRRNLPGLKFGNNARVVDYQGVSYPSAYTCVGVSSSREYPDYRQTACWHPLVTVPASGDVSLEFLVPDYEGDFTVVVEGMTASGVPVYAKSAFTVK